MNFEEQLRNVVKQHGQEQLLRFWNELNDVEKKSLLKEINEINLEEVNEFFKKANEGYGAYESVGNNQIRDEILQPPKNHDSVNRTNNDVLTAYWDRGLKEISENRVGVLLLAGGQGTRLGVDYPKGMYDVGLPSNKTLFQIQAERILKLQRLAKEKYSKSCNIIWYIMTSDATMKRTEEFFEKKQYFGLDKNNIVMFEQGILPCYDFNGKIILESKSKIAKSPDGNGGLYKALKNEGILEDMDKRGVKYLHAYCVDNILVKVADPVFLGFCVSKGADCGAKVVEKTCPEEPIGVICEVEGKYQVVEYSEISKATKERKKEDGKLLFNAGNICNHFFTTEFLKNIANKYETQLKLHLARKKIPYVDESGNTVKPNEPNGIKIEKFVFDVFPFATKFVTLEVQRDEEFSALKNSESSSDKDNPTTAKQSIFKLHKKYIGKVGGQVEGDGPCEISPLLSYAGEGEELKNLCINNVFQCPVKLFSKLETCSHQNGYH